MRELEISCKKFGLGLGVYLSPRDDHFGAATGGICKTPEQQAKYDAIYREQLTELLSGYGEMVEVWFDGATATPVGDLLKKFQPHAAVFQGPRATIRWVGNETDSHPIRAGTGSNGATQNSEPEQHWMELRTAMNGYRTRLMSRSGDRTGFGRR